MISRLAQRSAGTKEGSKVANEISCEDIPVQGEENNPGDKAGLSRTPLQEILSGSAETVKPKPSTDVTPRADISQQIAKVLSHSAPAQMRPDLTPEEDKPLVSSSITEDEVFERPQRPMKPAPKGIFFKKRKRTDFEIDHSKSSEEESSKSELDELFPITKSEKFKSDKIKKVREDKKKSYYVVETIEDIFG